MKESFFQSLDLQSPLTHANLTNIFSYAQNKGYTFFNSDTFEMLSPDKAAEQILILNDMETYSIKLHYLDTSGSLSCLPHLSYLNFTLYGHDFPWTKKFLTTYPNQDVIDNARYLRLLLDLTTNFNITSCEIIDTEEEYDTQKKTSYLITKLYLISEKDHLSTIFMNAWLNNITLTSPMNILIKNHLDAHTTIKNEFNTLKTYTCYGSWNHFSAEITITNDHVLLLPKNIHHGADFDLRPYIQMLLLLCDNFAIQYISYLNN